MLVVVTVLFACVMNGNGILLSNLQYKKMLPNSKMQIQNETKMFYTIRIVLISSYTVNSRRPKFLVKFDTNLMENV